jgi:hypothetical protein
MSRVLDILPRRFNKDFGYDHLTFSHGDSIMAVLIQKDKPFARRGGGAISK